MEEGKNGKAETQLIAETGVPAITKARIVDREALPYSPFTLVTIEEGCFIGMGPYRLTDIGKREDIVAMYESRNWDLIMAAVSVLQEVAEKASGFKQLS